MTWTWDIVNGDLAVWTFRQDASSDPPAATQSPDGDGWTWGSDSKGLREFPNEVFDLMWQVSKDYYQANVGDGTVDFTLFRFVAEAALEQIERR